MEKTKSAKVEILIVGLEIAFLLALVIGVGVVRSKHVIGASRVAEKAVAGLGTNTITTTKGDHER